MQYCDVYSDKSLLLQSITFVPYNTSVVYSLHSVDAARQARIDNSTNSTEAVTDPISVSVDRPDESYVHRTA